MFDLVAVFEIIFVAGLEPLSEALGSDAASGFALKALIHHSHVAVVRQAFRPDDKVPAWKAG